MKFEWSWKNVTKNITKKVSQVTYKYFYVLVALQKFIFNYMLEVLRPRKNAYLILGSLVVWEKIRKII